jgi:hypothetical protein
MHDQEIMDWLEQECGEDCAENFNIAAIYGEALPEHMYLVPDDMEPVKKILNKVLKDLGSQLKLLEYVSHDDDGYTWKVQITVHEGAA